MAGSAVTRSVALMCPLSQVGADDHGRGVEQDERAVGQAGPRGRVQTPAMRASHDPFSVELLVNRRRRTDAGAQSVSPGRAVGVVAVPAALRARAMPGGERNRLVVEEEECVVMRLPLLLPASPELERARDPEAAPMEPDDLVPSYE